MHKTPLLLVLSLVGCLALTCSSSTSKSLILTSPSQNTMTPVAPKLQINVGNRSFTATMADNNAVKALLTQLPLALDMQDLNRNEKFAKVPKPLPTENFNPGTIQRGDILLWGNQTLVIFYETFSSSYSYTRLGKIDDTTGLKEALGQTGVQVTFSKK